MKLATLRDGTRDGRLVVVSRDVTRCSDARHVAPTLQAALDDWDEAAPQLELIARGLEGGAQPEERFHERDAHSPLPRAYQWADGSAYVSHVELVRRARGAEMPAAFWTDPLMYQGGSDSFLDPRAPIRMADLTLTLRTEAGAAAGEPTGFMQNQQEAILIGGPIWMPGDTDTIVWWYVRLDNGQEAWAPANTSRLTLLEPVP
jgi:fumarylacetoacetate (FAA) hydrolase